MRARTRFIVALVIALGLALGAVVPVDARQFTAQIQLALQQLGIWPYDASYADGEVPVWNAASNKFVAGTAGGGGTIALDPSTCATPSISTTGAATTGIATAVTPTLSVCVGGSAVTTWTATTLTSTLATVINPALPTGLGRGTYLTLSSSTTGNIAFEFFVDSSDFATIKAGKAGVGNAAVYSLGTVLLLGVSNTAIMSVASTGLNPQTNGVQALGTASLIYANTFTNIFSLGNRPATSATAPTAAGTGMAFTVGTGSTELDWSITITTANAQSTFTLTLPTATNIGSCRAQNFTVPGSRIVHLSGRTTTTAVLTQYDVTTGLASAFADNDVIVGSCTRH